MGYGPEFVSALADDLFARLAGASVSKVEGGADWVVCHTRQGDLFLSWSADSFGATVLHPSEKTIPRILGATRGGIALALAKHLNGASIQEIRQERNDRVLSFRFRRFVGAGVQSEHTLILELTGRLSNAVLIDEEGIIVEPARHVHPDVNRYRTILPGLAYTGPPPLDGHPWDEISPDTVRKYLSRPLGIGRPLRAHLMALLDEAILDEAAIIRGLSAIRDGHSLTVYGLDGYLTVWPEDLPKGTPLAGTPLDGGRTQSLDRKLARIRDELVSSGQKALRRSLKGIDRHRDGLLRQLAMIDEAEALKRKGQAILANVHAIAPRSTEARLPFWDEEGKEVAVQVHLNPDLNPAGNAERYFKKYRKYSADEFQVRRNLTRVQERRDELETQRDNLERIQDLTVLRKLVRELSGASDRERPKAKGKRQEDEPPHVRYDVDRSVILVGLNERGNRHVTFRLAGPDDLWFHVHELPGSHVILKPEPGRKPEPWLIDTCASLALYYSKGASLPRCSVDYTTRKHVRHIPGAGPAQVTYKNSLSRTVTPDLWREGIEGPHEVSREDDSESS
ncbi:MAG: hypothetical protein CSA35_08540 [Dethiosulfovibrio peptidovorans]|nr:MAG: hypothetical protein CSA35_08540 [Dethiosulfovibrio peptidovorans]